MSQHLSLPKDKIRFLLLEGVHQNAIDVLNAAGYTNIDYRKTALEGQSIGKCLIYNQDTSRFPFRIKRHQLPRHQKLL